MPPPVPEWAVGSAGYPLPVVLLLLVPLLLVFVVVLSIVLLPLSLVQRYRIGKARRRGRGWLATVNFLTLWLSSMLFVFVAAITNLWVPRVLVYTVAGFVLGGLLGLLGLALTRWEATGETLHYTPNRWLVLGITSIVAARVAYGFWRTWKVWGGGLDLGGWATVAGIDGAMGAGATVLGYYLVYWVGVRQKLARWRRAGRATR